MKALKTLIKLAQQRVTNQRVILATYEKKAHELQQAMKALRAELHYEATRAAQDSYLTALYGRYAQGVEKTISTYQDTYQNNEKRLLREKDRLAKLFKDQKVLEIYQERCRQRQDAQLAKAQQKELDEIAARMTAAQQDDEEGY